MTWRYLSQYDGNYEYARPWLKMLTTIVREDTSIARRKVKRTSGSTADENGGAGLSTVEIKPLLGLCMMLVIKNVAGFCNVLH